MKMKLQRSPELVNIDGWPFRISKTSQQSTPPKVLLLLHGHLGNENVMWILAKPIPNSFTIMSPRAPVMLGKNQFSWHNIGPNWPELEIYQSLSDELLKRVYFWLEEHSIQTEQLDLMGFSQGAVMAYALAFLHPEKIRGVAAIAGFIPNSWKTRIATENLAGKRFFIAHGKKDQIVPITKAYQAKAWLLEHGTHINFCEAEIGHKLSANCFNSLEEFFK